MSKPIILASESPRRRALLEMAGIPFTVRSSGFDESAQAFESPKEMVLTLSAGKAHCACDNINMPALVIGADTVVFLNGRVFGKPAEESEAIAMLSALSGRTHTVYTGVTVVDFDPAKKHARSEQILSSANVTFRPLSAEEIRRYAASGEPFGKAGAYAVQERGSLFIEKVDGDFYTVVGLPLCPLYLVLKKLGYDT